MKKLLSLVMMLFMSVGMWASTEVFYESFDTNSSTGGNDGGWSGSVATGTLSFDNTGWTVSNGYGAYECGKFGTGSKKGTATTPAISVTNETVYKLTFNAGAWNGASEQTTLVLSAENAIIYEEEGCVNEVASVTMSKGAFTTYTLYVTATDANTSIQITFAGKNASNSRFFLDEVKLEALGGGTVVTVATPIIQGTTPFTSSTEVTMVCTTAEATIYYTLDGTDPDNTSTAYDENPIILKNTTTVKAIGYKNGEYSLIATKEFVKIPSISTAAEFNELPENTTFVFNGDLVVSGQKNYYLYAQDATGGVLIYGNAGQTYTKGQVIPAGFTAKKANYNGTIEMIEMNGMQASTETADLVAQELAVNQFADNQYIYAVVKGATIEGNTLTIGEETLAIYDRFGITFPTDDKTYDVYGVATIYNDAPQLLPIEFVESVVENTITFVAEQEGGTIAVALADGTPVESGVTKVAAGDKVTITATPAEGYKLSDIVVKCGDEVIDFDTEVTPGRAAETHTFTMPEGEVSIEATFEKETPTGIENLSMENVKSVRYYNAAGIESSAPFKGVNIVVREMTDGSKSVIKVVK